MITRLSWLNSEGRSYFCYNFFSDTSIIFILKFFDSSVIWWGIYWQNTFIHNFFIEKNTCQNQEFHKNISHFLARCALVSPIFYTIMRCNFEEIWQAFSANYFLCGKLLFSFLIMKNFVKMRLFHKRLV